jgi:hypothetical protein
MHYYGYENGRNVGALRGDTGDWCHFIVLDSVFRKTPIIPQNMNRKARRCIERYGLYARV